MAASTVNKIEVNMLLIGKTGYGRSATGNSILNRKQFESSSNATTENLDVTDASAEIGSFLIKVVDCPGLENPELTEIDDIGRACKNMAEALRRCKDGVHVFILVLKLGERFTREDQKTITTLRSIFGENYFKERGIIVLTCGDQLPSTMTFKDWCQAQQGNIGTLFMECSYRIALFNNVTENEEQKQRQREALLHEVMKIITGKGSYKNKYFQKNELSRKQLIKSTFTMFLESVQRKTNLLTDGLGCLTATSSAQDVERVEKQANDLLQEITAQAHEILQAMRSRLEDVQRSLQELKQSGNKEIVIVTLRKRKKELEECRSKLDAVLQKKLPWRDILMFFGIGVAVGVWLVLIASEED